VRWAREQSSIQLDPPGTSRRGEGGEAASFETLERLHRGNLPAVRVLVRNGRWAVPRAERPAGWQQMKLAKPSLT